MDRRTLIIFLVILIALFLLSMWKVDAATNTTDVCGYNVYTNTTLNYSVSVPWWASNEFEGQTDVLIVGGGGNGGNSAYFEYQTYSYGGGGGAGGVIYIPNLDTIVNETFYITVGKNATNSTFGNSRIGTYTAIRGGDGGYGFPDNRPGSPGLWGGSGGGGGSGVPGGSGGSNVTGQGFAGVAGGFFFSAGTGGGGGGAGGEGGAHGTPGAALKPGGPGLTFNFTNYSSNISLLVGEGGFGGDAIHDDQKFNYGNGGNGYWRDYDPAHPGVQGVVVVQFCAHIPRTYIDLGYPPKEVQFRVQGADGKEIPGSTVTIIGLSTTTGSTWDWILTLLGIPIDTVPIQETLMTGHTDSQGNTEFLMVPSVYYKVNVSAPGYNFPVTYVYPHDNEYLIWAYPATNLWLVDNQAQNGTILYSVSHARINATMGEVYLNYTDTGLSTIGGKINVSVGSTLLSSIAGSNSTNQTISIPLSSLGTSVVVSARLNTTNGAFNEDTAFSYDGQPVSTGLVTPQLFMFLAFALIILTAMGATMVEARYVAIMAVVQAWIYLGIGWFSPLTQTVTGTATLVITFTVATVFTILWVLKEGFTVEGK